MTDDEPEPFSMPTDPAAAAAADGDTDGADDHGAQPDDASDDGADAPAAADVDGAQAEDLDALVAAARAAVEEAAGAEDADRTSAAMWGDDDAGVSDPAAVWDDAATAAAENVWDLDDMDGASVWDETGASASSDDDRAPAPEPDPPAPAAPVGRPAAAEGMDHLADEDEEPETFAFPLQGDAGSPPPAAPPDDEEPETFRFAAGVGTGAPVPEPGPAPDDAEDEPETFTFAVDAGAAPVEPAAAAVPTVGSDPVGHPGPAASREPAEPTEADDTGDTDGPVAAVAPAADDASPVAAPAAADGDEDDDDIWTFSVAHDDSAPLAEVARPRDDSGWRDLEAAQEPRWAVPDLPLRQTPREDDEEEPAAFAMSVDDDASALGDLLDDAEATAGDTTTASPSSGYEPGELSDFDLDHLDDMVAAAEAAPQPTAEDAPTTEDVRDPGGDEEGEAGDAPLDAPTAARQVMEPGQVAFSSSRKKRRGLFG